MQDLTVRSDSRQAPDTLRLPSSHTPGLDDPLTAVIRRGARDLLAQAVEAEVAGWIDAHAHLLDEHGRRQVVRNGYAQARTVVTGIGPVPVQAPRVHDRRPASGGREHFTSTILPPYLRKARSVGAAKRCRIPFLDRRGRIGQSSRGRPRNWLQTVNTPMNAKELEAIQRSAKSCSPLGRPSWQAQMIQAFGLESTIRRPGRPRRGGTSRERDGVQ